MSARAFAGQENYRLIIKTGINFVAHPPSDTNILYRVFKETPKKDKFQSWDASVLVGEEVTGQIYHDFSVANPVPAAAIYEIRAHLTIDGRNVPTAKGKWIVEE